jgi:hypothetical protein
MDRRLKFSTTGNATASIVMARAQQREAWRNAKLANRGVLAK